MKKQYRIISKKRCLIELISFIFALLLIIVIMKYICFLVVIVVVQSMIGYGALEHGQYTLKIKSVNHRFLDLHIILWFLFRTCEKRKVLI